MDKPVLIIGAGVIGLSIGWQLARARRKVVVFDRGEAGHGASWAAGGMLAPVAEIGFEDPELYEFGRESVRRWPAFAWALEEETGRRIGFRTEGTLVVADDRDSAEALRRVYDFQKEQGLDVTWLTGAQALETEPFLAPRLSAAVLAPADYQVDNRQLVVALHDALLKRHGVLREHTPIADIEPDEQRPAVITEDGERIEGSVVVVAAGAWSRGIGGLPEAVRPPIRPVKGQMILLRVERPFDLQHVVRGPRAYLVPRRDGRLLVGATSEEMGFNTEVTAGGLYSILEGAWEIVPGIYDLPVLETWAGLRPASRDHAPLLGMSDAPGVVMATGHYRHGILHTPLTAEEVALLIMEGETSYWIEPFSPKRFSQ